MLLTSPRQLTWFLYYLPEMCQFAYSHGSTSKKPPTNVPGHEFGKKKKLTPKPQSSKHKFPGGEPWTKKNVLRWNRRWRPNSRLFLVTRASSVIRLLQLDTSSWPHWCQENSYHYKLQLSRTRNFRKFGRRSPADSSPLNSLNWFQMHSSWLKCEMCYHKHQPIFQW